MASPRQDWLHPQRLEYVALDEELAVVRVVAGLGRGLAVPGQVALVAGAPHSIVRAPVLGSVTHRPSRRLRTSDHLLWRVTFALPLELLECPAALFALTARDCAPTRLPAPALSTLEALCRQWELGPRGATLLSAVAWRRAAALGTAVAVAGAPTLPSAAAFAASGHPGQALRLAHEALHHTRSAAPQAHIARPAAATRSVVSSDHVSRAATSAGAGVRAHTAHVHIVSATTKRSHHHQTRHHTGGVSYAVPTASATSTSATTPAEVSQPKTPSGSSGAATGSLRHRHHRHAGAQTQSQTSGSGMSTISPRPPVALIPSDAVADTVSSTGRGSHHRPSHHHHHSTTTGHHRHGVGSRGHRPPSGSEHRPGSGSVHRPGAGSGHHHSGSDTHHGASPASGGRGLPALTPTPPEHLRHPAGPAPVSQPETQPAGTGVSSPGSAPSTNSLWTTGMGSSSAEVALLSHLSGLFTKGLQPPKFLIPIYKKASQRFHIPWEVLAAINSIETDYGRNLNISSAGAIGWMQFMPATWAQYGMSVSGHGVPNPFDPTDAIFSAARYLAANGGARHLRKAVFAYNHALWYVDSVMWRAGLITDHAQGIRHLDGYSLPLDGRYMHTFGRTDDGLDIEDAPDGAGVYSITPGVVTAVASDPTGFGPNYPVVRVTKGPLTGQYIYYGHVAASLVKVGQHVVAGQPIAVMGHTGDAASLGHGHIEIGFSDAYGDPLNHHGATAWTPSGAAMRRVLVALAAGFHIKVL